MLSRKVTALLALGLAVGSSLTTPQVSHAQQQCGVDLGNPKVTAAIKSQDAGLRQAYGWSWGLDPAYFDGNYDPCAPLSVVVTSVEGATGSSPDLAVLFHNGVFVGPATSDYRPFVYFDAARSTGDTVVLDYKDPNVCSACDGPITSVRYQWRGDRVEVLDPA